MPVLQYYNSIKNKDDSIKVCKNLKPQKNCTTCKRYMNMCWPLRMLQRFMDNTHLSIQLVSLEVQVEVWMLRHEINDYKYFQKKLLP